MGAWGVGNFDNDTALDWVYNLQKTNDISLISEAINTVFGESYIDADTGAEALAAIEVIARLQGHFVDSTEYTKEIDDWVKSHPLEIDQPLKEKAKKALELILEEKSELRELWDESGELNIWEEEVNSLKKCL